MGFDEAPRACGVYRGTAEGDDLYGAGKLKREEGEKRGRERWNETELKTLLKE